METTKIIFFNVFEQFIIPPYDDNDLHKFPLSDMFHYWHDDLIFDEEFSYDIFWWDDLEEDNLDEYDLLEYSYFTSPSFYIADLYEDYSIDLPIGGVSEEYELIHKNKKNFISSYNRVMPACERARQDMLVKY